MITCPNCNHQNPEGALQCEACYTPLPAIIACPSCNTPIQADASFCGQCGYDLREGADNTGNTPDFELPDLIEPDPLVVLEPVGLESVSKPVEPVAASQSTSAAPDTEVSELPAVTPPPVINATQLQTLTARLRQVQTGTLIEIPRELSVVRIGKPNDQTPPDVDVAGFPNSEVVSRVHANLRVEGDVYYLEDVGSSNGTYINGLPLPVGNRHRLRPGDRIAFGKGDKVSFIFETA